MKTIELHKQNFQESKGRHSKTLILVGFNKGVNYEAKLFWHNSITADQQEGRNGTCNQGTLSMSGDYIR